MSFDRNKAIEYMTGANKIIPKIVIFMVICWIAPPILISIGMVTNITIFSVLGTIMGVLSSILFYGLIFYIVIKIAKAQIKNGQPSETPAQNVSENKYTPSSVQNPEYTPVFREAENYEISSMEEQKQFEREIFAMQHPILNVLRKFIPFIWILAVLCIIIAGGIYFLDYAFGVKLHF